jgi:hypothetical protein
MRPPLQREQIPQEFHTSSRLAIITNEWRTLNRNVAALQDRGHVVIFEPTPQEVHTRTAEWYWDQEIYDFVGERLNLIQEASMRHYVAAWELKEAGLDWRSLLRDLLAAVTAPTLLYSDGVVAGVGNSSARPWPRAMKGSSPSTEPAATCRATPER